MENHEPLIEMFKALAHTARLEILAVLRDGEQCVCHMEAHLGYRQAYISQQLAVLREAGLIEDRRDGWNVYYRVIDQRVYKLVDAACAMTGLPELRRAPADGASIHCPCPKCATKGEAVTIPLREVGVRRVVAP